MKNGKTIVLGILAFLALQSGCVRENGGSDEESCRQHLIFYSLDREAANMLHENVASGELYAFHPDGTPAGQWTLNPVPDLYLPLLSDGQYDMAFVGNISDSMEYNRQSTRASGGGSIRMKLRNATHYRQADDVHIGRLETYVINRNSPDRIDSVHVKRQVGMVSIRIRDIQLDASQFRGEMIVSGVADGVDFFQNISSAPVDVIEYGAITDGKVSIDAKCFPSVNPLVVTARLTEIATGEVISEVSKTLEEMLTRNKHIIIEYKMEVDHLVEFDLIVKDWDNSSDSSSDDAH